MEKKYFAKISTKKVVNNDNFMQSQREQNRKNSQEKSEAK